MNLTDGAVYTIVHPEHLQNAAVKGGTSRPLHERRAWKGALELLKAARRDGARVPLLLADATNTSRLTHWAILEQVRIGDEGTHYKLLPELTDLRAARRTPQELILSSQGRNIVAGFIRPYALVETPDFLRTTGPARPLPARCRRLDGAHPGRLPSRRPPSAGGVHPAGPCTSPNAWGLTLRKDGRDAPAERGAYRGLHHHSGRREARWWLGGSAKRANGEQGRYRSTPKAAPHWVSFPDFTSTWRDMRGDHLALLESAASGRRGTSCRVTTPPKRSPTSESSSGSRLPDTGYAPWSGGADGDPEGEACWISAAVERTPRDLGGAGAGLRSSGVAAPSMGPGGVEIARRFRLAAGSS